MPMAKTTMSPIDPMGPASPREASKGKAGTAKGTAKGEEREAEMTAAAGAATPLVSAVGKARLLSIEAHPASQAEGTAAATAKETAARAKPAELMAKAMQFATSIAPISREAQTSREGRQPATQVGTGKGTKGSTRETAVAPDEAAQAASPESHFANPPIPIEGQAEGTKAGRQKPPVPRRGGGGDGGSPDDRQD